MQASTTPSTLTIGIDLGDRQSHICVLDADGDVATGKNGMRRPASRAGYRAVPIRSTSSMAHEEADHG